MVRSERRATNSEQSLLRAMREACDAARLTDAAALYDAANAARSAGATLLRARIHLKKNEPREAMRLLNAPAGEAFAATAEGSMLLAVSHSRVGDFETADDYFEKAANADRDNAFTPEIHYWRGRRYLEQRRAADARKQLDRMGAPTTTALRAKAATLESGILIQQERYSEAARVLMRMLEDLEDNSADVESWIWGLHTLAILARELDLPQARLFVKRRAQRDAWTPDFAVNRFQTLKAVAWCHALEGDDVNAFRYLKLAGENPPSEAWRAMIVLDRAYFARCLGEKRWSRDQLSEAVNILNQIEWRKAVDEEPVALLLAAELLAPVEPNHALNFSAQFSELPPAINPLLHFRYDRRIAAMADYASAIVQRQFGNHKAALAKLKKCWNVYSEIGYDWRAGRTALRIFEESGDSTWLARARQKLQNYGASWLYDELKSNESAEIAGARLTPAQLRIYNLLCEGRTTQEMCEITGCKPFTVQNHVKAVLKAFGAPNRAALVAGALRRSGI